MKFKINDSYERMNIALQPKSSDAEENLRLRADFESRNKKIHDLLEARIQKLEISPRWRAEGVVAPNELCRNLATVLVYQVWKLYAEITDEIWPSVDGGIMFRYWNNELNRSLKLDVDNDGDQFGVITQKNNILFCREISSPKDLEDLVTAYKNETFPVDCPELNVQIK